MYHYLITAAAGLWAGAQPGDVRLSSEYLRGQVELIIDMGLSPYGRDGSLDHDSVKELIAQDIRAKVQTDYPL